MNNTALLLLCAFVCIYAKSITVDVSNITLGIQSAESGDTLVLKSGTYPNLNYTMYGTSLSFVSESGNPEDVIMDGQGNNDWAPFMIYYDLALNSSLIPHLPTTLSISGMTFVNCGSFVALGDFVGGAIYMDSSNTSDVTVSISNSIFRNGFSDVGGAIFAYQIDAPITLSISNTTFTGSSGAEGAVLYAAGATVTITDCTFDNTTAYLSGGIYLDLDATLTFTNSNYIRSVAGIADGGDGGVALYMEPGTTATISNSQFDHLVGVSLGAIYSWGNLTIIDSTFTYSGNQFVGGAISTLGGHLTIVDCTFGGNDVLVDGGAIYALTTSVTIDGSHFTENIANNAAGAAVFIECSDVTITNCSFDKNGAGAGGAIFVAELTPLQLTNTNFTLNNADAGGAIYVTNASVALTNVSLSENSANIEGGAIYLDQYSSLTLQGSSLEGNTAREKGFAIYCTGASISVQNSVVSANGTSEKNGVYCDNSNSDRACDITSDDQSSWSDVCIQSSTSGSGGGSKKGSNKLPGWAIALIVIFAIAAVVAVAGLVFYIVKVRKENTNNTFSKM